MIKQTKPRSTRKPKKVDPAVDDSKSVATTREDVFDGFTKDLKEAIQEKVETNPQGVLDHLGDFIEEPFTILESYFHGQHLDRLVRHQIESYNHFINYQMQKTIQMFNPVMIRSENDYVEIHDKYLLEISVSFQNLKLYPPQIYENNGATKTMYPQEAKLRNFTYASTMTVDIKIDYIVRNTESMENPRIISKIIQKVNIGKMPIMLKSSICVLTQNRAIDPVYMGECPMDCGGYFIIKGSEKTVLGQERAAENRVYCFDGKNTTKWSWFAEIKSIPDFKCISPKQIEMMIASKNNGFGHGIYMNIPRIKQPIELFVVFRALGVLSDKEICQYILLQIPTDDPQQRQILDFLQASIIDANKYMTRDDALKHITTYVAYTPLNMDKEKGAKKKQEFTQDVLNNDLFPHCKTLTQKLYMLGYMCQKLIKTSFGWIPTDDRDSYVNKRIELTGTLLNNLFRNYFNKLVKEMQKQVVREINNGSWRSMDNYENIINMTNIYKIMKSTTIENGINRALATGDFSIKQSNSSKVGVAQVLNRLTYLSSLSHSRRINTPLEKSGELIAPRKLHGTTFGFLGPAESPEGQSIGVVKNISYMAHITIPTNSTSLYDYILPHILKLEDVQDPKEVYDKVKVFINGAWVGVTDTPKELYMEIKEKKYKGIINIYTSIIFDYKKLEIRVCNDGGRLTRPLLRVKDNRALITLDVIKKLRNKELYWNDLLVSCKLPESVIEYIDPEEQNFAMIAMKEKVNRALTSNMVYNYTHSEIHPSTIFGVLGSCIPFPDHNQSPRNTYQCLGINETVLYADGTTRPIKDVRIGDVVVTFHPDTLEITNTTVANHFVIPNNKEVYKITTQSGRDIIATSDHNFMTDKGWKTVEDLIHDPSIRIGISMQYNTVDRMTDDQRSVKNNCIFVPIESITKEEDQLVSCIETASENHSFITTHGILSKNCCMAKQAIGVYALNYDSRMDKSAYVLTYPSRPLVETRIMNFLQLNRIPSGHQCTVAIMAYTAYNQEDSLLINKGAIDRGLFMTTVYHTEKDEDKNIIRDEIIRCKPDPNKTKGIKYGNYDKLNTQGFIPEHSLVENRDVIIAKIVPIKENRNDPTKTIKYEDQSKTYRTTEECYVDKNYTGRNGDGYNFAKVRVRTLRKPVLGDKFASRSAQKGTLGLIIPEEDMPFTKDGLRPDIILNPHAIPSRMTIGQLKETLLGKVLVELGMFGDGTSFGNLDVKTICQELQKLGYESYGNEIMYNGYTGEQLETSIFVGPVYYQRLKHMVNDKQHSRSIGPMVNLTRQPAEGRSRDGGFRIGEMERDVMIAHGASRFCRERLYDVSDKYTTHVCGKCGMIACYNDPSMKQTKFAKSDMSVHLCRTCGNMTDFAKVEIPYAYKLLSQELQTINIVPRIITE
jgi:DNA-directed RNA polymerase beta subunit